MGSFFLLTILFVFINSYRKSKQEYDSKYNFIITKIDIDAKGCLIFRDSLNNVYSFASYRFTKWDNLGILNGDKVVKNRYSKKMILSRKEVEGNKYKIYHIQEPNGLIPYSFYSK